MSAIPYNWHETHLGELVILKYGKALPERVRSGSGFPVYGSNGIVGSHNKPLTSGPVIVIGRKGSVGEVSFSAGPCSPIDTTYYVDEFTCGEPRYWFYQLKTLRLSNLNKSTAIPGLNRKDAYQLEVSLAPLNEQKHIADKLDAVLARVDACRDRLDRIPATLKRFRQSVLAAATSGKLTEDWRNQLGESFCSVKVTDPYSHTVVAPDSWRKTSFGEICDLIGGSQPPKSTFVFDETKDVVRLIQIRDYKSDKFKVFIPRKLARRFCNKTEVMIGRYGPPIFQILRGLEGAYNVALMKAEPKIEELELDYLFYWLKGETLLRYVESGSERTAGQDGIRKELLNVYPFFLPPLAEQTEIVRRVEALFAFVDRVEARHQAARVQIDKLTPATLAKAFRGELVPQDPNDEPASKLLERIRTQRDEQAIIRPKRELRGATV